MTSMIIFNFIIYLISCFMFSKYYSHLLLTLMCLEIMMLSLMMFIYSILLMMKIEYLLMMYLMIVVCEGVLGLSLLILYVRFKGIDKLNLMNLIMW